MDPMTLAMAGAALGNVVGGLWGASENQKTTDALLKRLRELQDRIEKEWMFPEQDRTPLTLEEFKLLETYTPELAQFIQEDSPGLLKKLPTEATQNRAEAMNRFKELSYEGTSPTTKAAAERAELEATSAHKGRMNELMKNMQQRGLSGSGQELIAGIEGGARLAEGQRASALTEAENANQRKIQALRSFGDISGQISNEELAQQQYNNQLLNDYKKRMTDRRQNYEAYRSGTLNEANKFNMMNRQDIANKNVGIRNQGTLMNQARNEQYNRDRERSMNERLRLLTGLGRESAYTEYGGRQQQTQAITGMIGSGGNILGALSGRFAAGGKSAAPEDYMSPWEASNWYGSSPKSRSS